MKFVYLLMHLRADAEDEDLKTIGIYSSQEAAESAIQALRSRTGFVDYPDGFSIGRYEVNKTFWADGFG